MAKKKVKNSKTTWSYSAWSLYHQCAFKYKCRYIDKLPDPPSPAMARGTAIHLLAENTINGEIYGMPRELEKFKKEFATLRRMKKRNPKQVITEIDLSATRKWKGCDKFDKDVWVRAFLDVLIYDDKITNTVIDHKTGKVYDSHKDQNHLYGTLSLQHYENTESVDVEFFYLDQGKTTSTTYERKNLPRMIEVWERRVDNLFSETAWEPTPNFFCKWCVFSNKKGGPCDY